MIERRAYPGFRLDFEQQRKRAKDLLKAARAGDAAALARFSSPPQLAEAQQLIARELRPTSKPRALSRGFFCSGARLAFANHPRKLSCPV